MPIFEYICRSCRKKTTALVMSRERESEVLGLHGQGLVGCEGDRLDASGPAALTDQGGSEQGRVHAGKGRAVDCELAWSPDSITWRRVAPGTPFFLNASSTNLREQENCPSKNMLPLLSVLSTIGDPSKESSR